MGSLLPTPSHPHIYPLRFMLSVWCRGLRTFVCSSTRARLPERCWCSPWGWGWGLLTGTAVWTLRCTTGGHNYVVHTLCWKSSPSVCDACSDVIAVHVHVGRGLRGRLESRLMIARFHNKKGTNQQQFSVPTRS